MHLNHLNLPVQNVAAATEFFQAYFGFRLKEIKGDNVIAILHGSDGFILVLMSDKNGSVTYPNAFHIGFMLESREAVTALYQQLQAGGIEAGREPAKIRDSFGFYFHFDNILIEVGLSE